MTAPEGFRRSELRSLQVGDVIWFNGLVQSRTGMIARVPVRGRIVSVELIPRRVPWSQPSIRGAVQDEYGDLQPFHLRGRNAVFVQRPPADQLDDETRPTDHPDDLGPGGPDTQIVEHRAD